MSATFVKPQTTIANPVEMSGHGLFTGEPVSVRFKPAGPYTGLVFVRTDQPKPVRIPARVDSVSRRARRTSLKNGTVTIETVEHCLSACAGLGVDNLEIEITGSELPGVDGSCLPYVRKLQEAQIVPLDVERQTYVIPNQTIRVVDGDAELIALPSLHPDSDVLEIQYDLDYGPGGPIGHQIYSIRVTAERFVEEIAASRTFVLQHEAEEFRRSGMGAHLTYQDIVVFGENGPIENELRFSDECVRHKILDLIGDLMLLGKFLVGRVFARKSGHALNQELVRRLLQVEENEALSSKLVANPLLDIRRIQRVLPHRYPFLLLDRLIEIDGTRRAVGLKNVTINEAFFQGHYPGQPIMPGVLIIEAMSQLGGVLLSQDLEHKGRVAVLLSMDHVKFRRAVMPGDQLILEADTVRVKPRTGHVRCKARVGDQLVAEAEIKFMLVDAEPV